MKTNQWKKANEENMSESERIIENNLKKYLIRKKAEAKEESKWKINKMKEMSEESVCWKWKTMFDEEDEMLARNEEEKWQKRKKK